MNTIGSDCARDTMETGRRRMASRPAGASSAWPDYGERTDTCTGTWGDDWIHGGVAGLLSGASSTRNLDPDELVFLIPGVTPRERACVLPQHEWPPVATEHEAIAASLRSRINAAYFEPRFQYLHDQLALAAWYGVVATGRSAWLVPTMAWRIADGGLSELGAAADDVYEPDIHRWWLERRLRAAARKVVASGRSRVVAGLALAARRQESNQIHSPIPIVRS